MTESIDEHEKYLEKARAEHGKSTKVVPNPPLKALSRTATWGFTVCFVGFIIALLARESFFFVFWVSISSAAVTVGIISLFATLAVQALIIGKLNK